MSNITTQDKLKEYFKCKNDPVYFIEKYVQLEEVGGNVSIDMYDPQKDFLNTILKDHHTIVLKSRQIGISTIVQCYIAYTITFYKNVVIGMVSKDGPEATDFCRKVMGMIRNLPDWLRPTFTKDTEQTFILDNGCKFYASQVNSNKPGALLRGKSVTILVVDEAAHISKIDEAYTGLGLTLSKNQKIAEQKGVPFATIIISTPNKTIGLGKWFFDQWTSAHQEESIYKPIEIHWKQIKEFRDDPNWYKKQCSILNNIQWKIDQELEMKFLSSENSFFPSETVLKLNECSQEPKSKISINGYQLYLFDTPRINKFYLIGIDTASQSGSDYSAIQVMDYETFEQIGEFKAKLRVDAFCKVIDGVNRVFPNNLLIVESNSYGNQVVEHLTSSGEPYNLYRQKSKNTESDRHTYKYGISTTSQTRPLMIDSLYTYISENTNLVKSSRTALELIALIRKNDRVEADVGENDDLALALSFCSYVRMYDPPVGMALNPMNQNLTEQIIDTIAENFDNNLVTTELLLNSENNQDSSVVTINKYNKLLQQRLKKNLLDIVPNSDGVIDMTKFLRPPAE